MLGQGVSFIRHSSTFYVSASNVVLYYWLIFEMLNTEYSRKQGIHQIFLLIVIYKIKP